MRLKLGLKGEEKEDKKLIEDLLDLMERFKMDFTNTFIALGRDDVSKMKELEYAEFQAWYLHWIKRATTNDSSMEDAQSRMAAYNPQFIPRNHLVEESLERAAAGDMTLFNSLLEILRNPYAENSAFRKYQTSPTEEWEKSYQTFCGT